MTALFAPVNAPDATASISWIPTATADPASTGATDGIDRAVGNTAIVAPVRPARRSRSALARLAAALGPRFSFQLPATNGRRGISAGPCAAPAARRGRPARGT